jgi:hypothetical protein
MSPGLSDTSDWFPCEGRERISGICVRVQRPSLDGVNDTANDIPGSEPEIERVRNAVNLVMHDVEAIFGSDLLTVLVAGHEDLSAQLASRGYGPPGLDITGYVIRSDHTAIGIWAPEGEPSRELVVRVAEVIQEGVIEGPENWGAAFPPCPEHPNHPMDAAVAGGIASWVCPKGLTDPIPIGKIEHIR